MKLQLQFEQKDSPYGYKETKLARIKLTDDDGKYIKFLKHDEELIKFLEELKIDYVYKN